mmetsp:Transcript_102889/g.331948  ORF Transcript_102889/g.331948 Transcript_102889/m.331948 type:complete len:215 (-) Transcript_102889:34-678(-)
MCEVRAVGGPREQTRHRLPGDRAGSAVPGHVALGQLGLCAVREVPSVGGPLNHAPWRGLPGGQVGGAKHYGAHGVAIVVPGLEVGSRRVGVVVAVGRGVSALRPRVGPLPRCGDLAQGLRGHRTDGWEVRAALPVLAALRQPRMHERAVPGADVAGHARGASAVVVDSDVPACAVRGIGGGIHRHRGDCARWRTCSCSSVPRAPVFGAQDLGGC